MKRMRSLVTVLFLMVLVGCLTFTVSANNDEYTPIASRMDYMPDPRQPDTYVPPVYYGDASVSETPDVYHTTIEDAAEELRELMEDRVTSIVIGYQTTSSDYDKRLEVFDKALEHTGVPTQGDYLAFQHGAFQYGYDGYSQNGTNYITFIYEITYYTTAQQEAQVDTAVDNLLNVLDVDDGTDYEKISAIYDYMTENITYDNDGLTLENQTHSNKKIFTAYAALIDGTSVCQGYANLFYRLALELGVDTRIIAGTGNGGGHAWNIVELNNLYYDVDATWDASWKQAGLEYEYFLRCDANFGDHIRDAKFLTNDFQAAYPMSKTDYYRIIASGSCGANVTWILDSNYQLTISGTGEISSKPYSSGYYNVKSIVIEPGVTSIGNQVLSNFSSLEKITIPSSVTTIDFGAFYYSNNLQTILYGGTQKNWDAVTIDMYNDSIENANIIYLGEIKLSGASPVLYENMAIQYKANKTKFDTLGITDPYLVVTFNGVETVITDYQISDDGTRYIFTFYNIAPNQMNDTITAVLYASYNGEVYAADPKDYSMAEYCYTQLGKYSDEAYAEFRTLLVDLLNYGAVSQQFTGYKTDNLVNAALTETQKSWATQTDRSYTNVQTTKYATISNPTVSWKGGSLVLTDAVVMRLRFETANTEGLSFKVTSGSRTWWISDISTEGGSTYIYFRGLNAGQMSDEVFITAYQNGVAVSNTVRYSIESYASQKIADTATPYLAELVDAMMKYGDSAKAYIS